MRDIKFRAWENTNKRYVDSRNLIITEDAVFEDWRYQEDGICGDLILEQFTGLRDKNGKEIYEGDIVKISRFNGESVIHGAIFEKKGAYHVENGHDLADTDLLGAFKPNIVKVIGNIHENPELLK